MQGNWVILSADDGGRGSGRGGRGKGRLGGITWGRRCFHERGRYERAWRKKAIRGINLKGEFGGVMISVGVEEGGG